MSQSELPNSLPSSVGQTLTGGAQNPIVPVVVPQHGTDFTADSLSEERNGIDELAGPPSSTPRRRKRRKAIQTNGEASGVGPSEVEQTLTGAGATETVGNSEPVSSAEQYKTLGELGRGGWGVVERAFDKRLEREVAIKRMSGPVASQTGAQQIFEREAKVTSQLQHPSIVPVHEVGRTQLGESFYAMKLLEGESLRDCIRGAHANREGDAAHQLRSVYLPLLDRFISVCNAIAFAHKRGVIHRDLKPANVMAGEFGETIVVDWGLAVQVGESGSLGQTTVVSEESTQVGTPAYMSPEQAAASPHALATTSDVYSLGVMLFEIISGVSPHTWDEIKAGPDGSDATELTQRILERVAAGELPGLRTVSPNAPKCLAAVCAKAMAHQPSERYVSADELAADVRRYIEGDAPHVYAEPLLDKIARWCSRHRAMVTTICMASTILLLVSVAFGVVISQAHKAELAAKKDAEQAHAEAMNRLAQARHTADTWLIDLSGSLQFYPGMEPLRNQLIQTALVDYQSLLDADDMRSLNKPTSASAQLLLEKIRLKIRLHDLSRLSGRESGGLSEVKLLLGQLESQLTSLPPGWQRNQLERDRRLECVNALTASLLSPAESNALVDSYSSEMAWLHTQMRSQASAYVWRNDLQRSSDLDPWSAKTLSAAARLSLAAGRLEENAPLFNPERRLDILEDAASHARYLAVARGKDSDLRLAETALRELARTADELGAVDISHSAWSVLASDQKRLLEGAAPRSDRLQAYALTLLNQAAVTAGNAAERAALYDAAIDNLYAAWDLLDPDGFFETNLATANYNSAKLLIESGAIESDDVQRRLTSALHVYESMLRRSVSEDTLRRLAECHFLIGQIPGQDSSAALEHFDSADLAFQMLNDHGLARNADRVALARVKLAAVDLLGAADPEIVAARRGQAVALLNACKADESLADSERVEIEKILKILQP